MKEREERGEERKGEMKRREERREESIANRQQGGHYDLTEPERILTAD